MTRSFTVAALLAVAFAAISSSAQAQPRPTVLELFTSEGCSSCPPAETLVTELAQRHDVLALSFHVDYWDGLGWRDPYSLASATERQRRYARTLRLSSIYTPQAVIEGSHDIVGSDRGAVMKALAAAQAGVGVSVTVEQGQLRITVAKGSSGAPADVMLFGYLRQATTHIGRGENSGRTLTESNIVRVLQDVGSWRGEAGEYQVKLDSLPADVTDVAVLVQAAGQGAILGAAVQPIR